MPKIVDKEQKRKDIAQACTLLLLENGIKDLTVSQVAITAGIGKGTIYEYFKNKEDIVFEIINVFVNETIDKMEEALLNAKTSRQRAFIYFDFLLDNSEENLRQLKLYQEYLGVTLASKNSEMCQYNTQCSCGFETIFSKIIKDGIANHELIEDAERIVPIILIAKKGMVISHGTQIDFDLKANMTDMINTIFDLIEVKK
ncbi:MAG: TetR/AcrR family transcriptional regulator [Candidatus Marinarcus sp.]|uniref:TetR/AcrR family transcriptional regulator n=1 Tax=Candidatus Marinarcus sp. TaxID=3100987 RepID=UPI003B002EC2